MSDLMESLTGHRCDIAEDGVCIEEGHGHALVYLTGFAGGQEQTLNVLTVILAKGLEILGDDGQPCPVDAGCNHDCCTVMWVCAGVHESMTRDKWQSDNLLLSSAVDDALAQE